MSYAVLFAGQGNQHAQMIPWLAQSGERSIALREMAHYLPAPWHQIVQDAALRQRNQIAQPLITGTSIAAWELLREVVPCMPAVAAGYSLGELAACACAEVLSIPDAVRLSVVRAQCMDQAAGQRPAGLLSVSGIAVEQVLALAPTLSCAIRIDFDHALFGGYCDDLARLQLQWRDANVTCKWLDIDVASHTPLMASAAEAFATVLRSTECRAPRVALVMNASATVCRSPEVVRGALSAQISAMVDWAQCMDAVAERGVRCVLQVGPGSALANLWNRRHPDIAARSVEDFESPRGAAMWIERNLR